MSGMLTLLVYECWITKGFSSLYLSVFYESIYKFSNLEVGNPLLPPKKKKRKRKRKEGKQLEQEQP